MEGRFQAPGGGLPTVRLEQISDHCFLSEEPFEYVESRPDGTQHVVTVPGKLLTDLASIPQPLRFFEGRHGRHTLAALLHDYQVDDKSDLKVRTDADDRFQHALISLGMKSWRATVMWSAVHLMSRWVSSSLASRVATVLWTASAFVGYYLLVTAFCAGKWDLVVLACVGPLFGALLWMIPDLSFKRYKCGLTAGLALSVLGPFALVNLFVIGLAKVADSITRSKPHHDWAGATACPRGLNCSRKCGRGQSPTPYSRN